MPRGTERQIAYIRELDARGRTVVRAVPAQHACEGAAGSDRPQGERKG